MVNDFRVQRDLAKQKRLAAQIKQARDNIARLRAKQNSIITQIKTSGQTRGLSNELRTTKKQLSNWNRYKNERLGRETREQRKIRLGTTTQTMSVSETSPIASSRTTTKETELVATKRIIGSKQKFTDIVKLKPKKEILVSQTDFSKAELELLKTYKNKSSGVKQITFIKEARQAEAKKALENFVKASIKEIETEKDITILKRVVKQETNRRKDKNLQLAVEKVLLKEETKKAADTIKKGAKIENWILKDVLYNVYLGAFNVASGIVKAGEFGIKGMYNYGGSLVNRGLWTKGKTNPVFKDITKLTNNIGSVGAFVKNNPGKSVVIVGIAASVTGKSILKAFNKNPVATLTEALIILSPGKVIKVGKVFTKALEKKAFTIVKVDDVFKLPKSVPVSSITFNKKKFVDDLNKKVDAENKRLDKLRDKAVDKFNKAEIESRIKLNNKNRSSVKKKIKSPKLNPITISKKLNEIFKEKPITIKKIKTTLPSSPVELNKLLLAARKQGGKAFSDLKKRIKKEKGLNVVQRSKKNKITFKILEPKEQRRLGKKKEVKKQIVVVGKELRIEKIKKTVIKAIPENPKKKLNIRELDKLEKQIALELKRSRTRKKKSLINNKKAQLQTSTQKQYHKRNKNIKKRISNVKQEVREWKQAFKELNKQLGKDFKKLSSKSQQRLLKKKKAILSKQKKLKIEIQSLRTALKLDLKELVKLALRFKLDMQVLQKFIFELDSLLKQDLINDFKKPKPVKPTGNGGKITKTALRPPKVPRIPKTPKVPKLKLRVPRVPRVPPKEPKIPKIPLLTFDTKLPKGTRLKFNAVYKSKGKFILLHLGLPLNKAKKRIAQLIDRTTSRSMKLKISGVTKAKDIKVPKIIKKFRAKRSKNKKVLDVVEKSKHAIDSKGEKTGLTIGKLLKKKKTPKKIKKARKKSIKRVKKVFKKRSKKLKRSK